MNAAGLEIPFVGPDGGSQVAAPFAKRPLLEARPETSGVCARYEVSQKSPPASEDAAPEELDLDGVRKGNQIRANGRARVLPQLPQCLACVLVLSVSRRRRRANDLPVRASFHPQRKSMSRAGKLQLSQPIPRSRGTPGRSLTVDVPAGRARISAADREAAQG